MKLYWQTQLSNISFKSLGVDGNIASHLDSIGFANPTAIQKETLPLTLEKKDVIVKAHTGSGKTLSFAIPILKNLDVKKFDIQCVVLTPTRELAEQVANEIRKVMKYLHNTKVITLCGGVPYKPQVHSLFHKAHIIVGTPGRILKHLENDNFSISSIHTLVLDEADRMLDMGFFDDMKTIIDYFPKERHTMLFSATYPNEIEQLAHQFMKSPISIDITDAQVKPKIEELFILSTDKEIDIVNILNRYNPKSTIIFCNQKIECDELADYLESQDIYPLVLHSDLEQKQRVETLTLFENKSYKILIATDVASRGLDVDSVELVINYGLPRDHEFYTHRIGRTARAGSNGTSIALIEEYQKQFLDEYTTNPIITSLEKSKNIYNDKSEFDTILLLGGKKQKLRRGDIVGSLTNEYSLDFKDIGMISQKEKVTYVAINCKVASKFKSIKQLKIKGKMYYCIFVS